MITIMHWSSLIRESACLRTAVYMMVEQTNPALTSAQSLMYLFYRESFVAGNKGYASAIVVWTVLLIGLVTLVQFIGQKKWVNYEV